MIWVWLLLVVAVVAGAAVVATRRIRLPGPEEAFVVFGGVARSRPRVVVGSRVFVLPGQQVISVPLRLYRAHVAVECRTTQAIRLGVTVGVDFRIGADAEQLLRATQFFRDADGVINESTIMERVVGNVNFCVRQAVGQETAENVMRSKRGTAEAIGALATAALGPLGLVLQTVSIVDVHDLDGFLKSLEQASIAEQERVRVEQEQAERQREIQAKERAEMARLQSEEVLAKTRAELEYGQRIREEQLQQKLLDEQTRTIEVKARYERDRQLAEARARAEADAEQRRIQSDAAKNAAIRQAEADAQRRKVMAGAKEVEDVQELKTMKDRLAIQTENEREQHKVRVEAMVAEATALTAHGQTQLRLRLVDRLIELQRAQAEAFPNLQRITSLGDQDLKTLLPTVLTMYPELFGVVRELLPEGAEREAITDLPGPPPPGS